MPEIGHMIYEGDVSGIVALVEGGLNINARVDDSGNTLLHLAAQAGQPEIIHALLKRRAKVNRRNVARETPLHLAMDSGSEETVLALLIKGAKPNLKDRWGRAPLHKVHTPKIAMILIAAGAKVNLRESPAIGTGGLPIHDAALRGYTEVVRVLLDAGSAVSPLGCYDETPLHPAARSGHVETCRILLEAGAVTNRADHGGRLPVELAYADRPYVREEDKKELVELFGRYQQPGRIDPLMNQLGRYLAHRSME